MPCVYGAAAVVGCGQREAVVVVHGMACSTRVWIDATSRAAFALRQVEVERLAVVALGVAMQAEDFVLIVVATPT